MCHGFNFQTKKRTNKYKKCKQQTKSVTVLSNDTLLQNDPQSETETAPSSGKFNMSLQNLALCSC